MGIRRRQSDPKSSREWHREVEELLYQVKAGAKPLATVECSGATMRQVTRFVRHLESTGRHRGPVRSVLFRLTRTRAEDYDFMVDDGVEVAMSSFPELLDIHAKVQDLPPGKMRAALLGFLYGYSAENIAAHLKSLANPAEQVDNESPAADGSGTEVYARSDVHRIREQS